MEKLTEERRGFKRSSLSERSPSKRTHSVQFHLQERLRKGGSTEAGSGVVTAGISMFHV